MKRNEPQITDTPSALLTRRQACHEIQACPRTLDELIRRGLIPTVRFSKRMVRIPRAALLEALQRKTVGI